MSKTEKKEAGTMQFVAYNPINSKADTMVLVHGYSENVPSGYMPWAEVVEDRLKMAQKVVDYLEDHDIDTYFVISGGTKKNGVTEAQAMKSWLQKYLPDLYHEIKDYLILEEESLKTSENVKKMVKMADQLGVRTLLPVTSKDHASRVVRDWAYEKPEGSDLIIAGVPSKDSYSEKSHYENVQPFIAEPPFWAREILDKIFKVPGEYRGNKANREAFKKELEELYRKFGVAS
ncbi:MAG: YdcF family protein [Candidatus Aenigmarchaeota archaeon]|nr:YdcF family protein [Candidatus Aenigmarchaeota archaeon]